MKNKNIKVTIRRTCGGDHYVIESLDGSAGFSLYAPPKCSSRDHKYHAGDTITQEEADAIALELSIKTLAPKE